MMMKKIFLMVALIATMVAQQGFAQGGVKETLLNGYYGIKDALVSSDAAATAGKAAEFLKLTANADFKGLSAADASIIRGYETKLNFDARHISESKDLVHQREHFAAFSANFTKLAKAVKLSSQPVYADYCPMNKSYWLSADKTIKNPYYGKQMLDCGSVKETL